MQGFLEDELPVRIEKCVFLIYGSMAVERDRGAERCQSQAGVCFSAKPYPLARNPLNPPLSARRVPEIKEQLPSPERRGNNLKELKDFHRKPRPAYGLDCLIHTKPSPPLLRDRIPESCRILAS